MVDTRFVRGLAICGLVTLVLWAILTIIIIAVVSTIIGFVGAESLSWDHDGLDCDGGPEVLGYYSVRWHTIRLLGWVPAPTDECLDCMSPVYSPWGWREALTLDTTHDLGEA